ncbi:Uncharacterized membrane protein [Arenibacter nanhaiticus]|uniref:Uncharacterized membrane protein n=1 Tax=Arenibacter nanhaiticus TaxID=558155 RepID=A0A1M6CCC4_9FLAO|nr:c-type cytochrome domain-containing protein [Arenibacter nanhaiticus]SHI58695.1 Uncharacterized membrane protein [Arenibacter nanhaiticus]
MEVIQQLIGRLHPVVVHLPIGFIITGLLLQWYDRKENNLTNIIALVFLWGFIAATIACISGYFLYLGEGYAFDTVALHLWSGVFTALFSLLMFLRLKEVSEKIFLKRLPIVMLSFSLLFLISITGHLGGNITHGSDYLTEPLPQNIKTLLGIRSDTYEMPVLQEDNWEEAVLYEEVVQPILNNKCVSCHNPKKDKGELQLQEEKGILKGGENGAIIKTNDPENSSIYARLVLPLDHEDHMPPKDKTQLTKEEIEIIKAWIANNNDFDKKIGELGLQKELFTAFFPKTHKDIYPNITVAEASMDSIVSLKTKGLHIEPISVDNNFLKVSCTNNPLFGDEDVKSLAPILKQTVYLDLGDTQITDEVFDFISQFPNLTVLKLDKTDISGKHIEKLKNLEHLTVLNLTGTSFKEEHLSVLSAFKQLKTVYLYNTPLAENNIDKTINETHYNFGNYKLPIRASDSIIY